MRWNRTPASIPLLAACLMLAGCAEPVHLESRWTSLGRPASAEVWATTEQGAARLLEEFPQAMESVAATMSLDRPDSELNRVNREAAGAFYRVESHDLYRCIGLGLDYAKASDATYDPTIGPVTRLYREAAPDLPDAAAIEQVLPRVDWTAVSMEREAFSLRFRDPGMSLDLSGMLEGYALDVAGRKFVRVGSRAGLIRLGHDVYAWGAPPGLAAWSVDLDDPRRRGATFVTLDVASRSIAVSGSGGDSEIVIDPRTGRPADSDVRVAVAIADSVADAAAIARALVAGGARQGGALLARTRRVEAVMLVRSSAGPSVIASASLQGRLRLAPEVAREVGDRVRYLLPPTEL